MWSTENSIVVQIEEHIFNHNPAVGSSPDMVHDDLPTNVDYLDEAFGAPASFHAVHCEDYEGFDVLKMQTDTTWFSTEREDTDDETIRLNAPLHVVERYFDTLPADLEDSVTWYYISISP